MKEPITKNSEKRQARGDMKPSHLGKIEKRVKYLFSMYAGAVKEASKPKQMEKLDTQIDYALAQRFDSVGNKTMAEEMKNVEKWTPGGRLRDRLLAAFRARPFEDRLTLGIGTGLVSIVMFGLIAFVLVWYRGTDVPILRNITDQSSPIFAMQKSIETEYGVGISDNSFSITSVDGLTFRSLGISNKVSMIPDVPVTVSLSDDGSELSVTPEETLLPDTEYIVTIKEGTMLSDGTSLAEDFSWAFRTEPDFLMTGITPRDESESAPVDTAIEVELTYKDVSLDDIGRYFSVTPEVKGRFEKYGKKIVFLPTENLVAGNVYSVTVKEGLQNSRGDELPRDYTSTFKVGYRTSDDKYVNVGRMYWSDDSPVISTTQDPWMGIYTYGLEGNINFSLYSTTPEGLADVLKNYKWDIYQKPSEEYLTKVKDFSKSVADADFFNMDLGGYGIYFVEASHPSFSYPLYKFFVYSPLGAMRSSSQSTDIVWLSNMDTKEPVSGGVVSFYDFDVADIPVHTATTDENGYAYMEDGGSELMVVKSNNNYAVALSGSISNTVHWWLGGWMNRTYGTDSRAYVYFDKPLYRPGDTIRYKVVVRHEEDMSYTVPDGGDVTVRVGSSEYLWSGLRNLALYEETIPLSDEFGTGYGEFELPSNTDPGMHTMQAIVGGVVSGQASFTVAEYQKPRYQFEMNVDKVLAFSGDTITVDVYGTDYSGDPASGVSVGLRVYRGELSSLNWVEDAGALDREQLRYSSNSNVGEATLSLDSAGHATYSFVVDASVYSSKFASYSVYLWSEDNYVNHDSDYILVSHAETAIFAQPDDMNVPEGGDNTVTVKSVDLWDFDQKDGVRIEYDVERKWWEWVEDGEYYDPVTKTQRPTYRSVTHTEVVETDQEVVTDDQGFAEIQLTDLADGQYSIIATYYLEDEVTRTFSSLFSVYKVPEDGDGANYWDLYNEKVTIYTDKDSYDVGQKATVTVKTTLEGKGLYMVKRGEVYDWRIINLTDGMVTLQEIIEDVMAPSVDFCVWGIDEYISQQYYGTDISEEYLSNVFTGRCTSVSVEREFGRLSIEVDSDKDTYGPGDEVTLDITVKDQSGKGVAAEVSVDVVDRALLDIVRGSSVYSTDIYESFYETVKQKLTMAGSPFSYNYSSYGGYGGGGGGEESIRSNFADAAFWDATVKTSTSGRAEVTFTLPDDLTTWSARVIGVTQDTRVGEGYTEFIARKDIRLDTNVPKYLRSGDTLLLGLDACNYSGTPLNGTVEVACNGCSDSTFRKDIQVAAGNRLSVSVPVQPLDGAEEVVVVASLSSDDTTHDAVEWTIPVLTDGFVTNDTDAVLLEDGQTEGRMTFTLPGDTDVSRADLRITTARSYINEWALVSVDPGVSSSVQLASSIIHNSVFVKYYDEIGPQEAKSIFEEKISSNVDMLSNNQGEGGGFGWFDYDAINYETSAYVGLAYGLAAEVDLGPEGGRLENLQAYLWNGLYSEDTSIDEKILGAYALSMMGDTTVLPYAINLKNHSAEIADSPLDVAHLMLALQRLGSVGDSAELIPILEASARYSGRAVTWQDADSSFRVLHTEEYTTAVVYQALAAFEGFDLMEFARTWLVENPVSVSGNSSDAVAIFYALAVSNIENLQERQEIDTIVLKVNGTEVKTFDVGGDEGWAGRIDATIASRFLRSGENVIEIERTGEGEIYVVGNLTYNTSIIGDAQEFTVSRQIRSFTTGLPVASVDKGDVVLIRTSVLVDRDGYNMMVRDFIPAGFEPVQYRLGDFDYEFYRIWWQWGQDASVHRYGSILLDHIAYSTYEVEDGKVYTYEFPAVATYSGEFSGAGSQAYLEGFGDIGGVVSSPEITVEE